MTEKKQKIEASLIKAENLKLAAEEDSDTFDQAVCDRQNAHIAVLKTNI